MKACFFYINYLLINILKLVFDNFKISYPYWYIKMIIDEKYTLLISLRRKKEIQSQYILHKKNNGVDKFVDLLNHNHNKYFILVNTYPYNINNGVKHYVLWLKDNNIQVSYEIIKNELEKNNIRLPFCYGKNLPKNKSIPEIEHYHIFVKYN